MAFPADLSSISGNLEVYRIKELQEAIDAKEVEWHRHNLFNESRMLSFTYQGKLYKLNEFLELVEYIHEEGKYQKYYFYDHSGNVSTSNLPNRRSFEDFLEEVDKHHHLINDDWVVDMMKLAWIQGFYTAENE